MSVSAKRINAFRRSFMSRPAADMWQVATALAGFDAEELWADIIGHTRGGRSYTVRRITQGQVERAMGRVSDRYRHLPPPDLDAMADALTAAAKEMAAA